VKLTKIQELSLLALYRGDPWKLVPITRRALLRLQLIAPPKPYALTELGHRLAEQIVRRDARGKNEEAAGTPAGEDVQHRGASANDGGSDEIRSRRGSP
jgi:hypothetical protein